MLTIIEEKREELDALCREFHVRTLELFGSAARGTFDPATSDLDFLVDIPEPVPRRHADHYFGMLFGLEALFGRKIDLLESGAIRNPYLLRSIDEDRMVVYAA